MRDATHTVATILDPGVWRSGVWMVFEDDLIL